MNLEKEIRAMFIVEQSKISEEETLEYIETRLKINRSLIVDKSWYKQLMQQKKGKQNDYFKGS